MAKLYEVHGIPDSWLEYDEPPDYALVYDRDDERGTFNNPHGFWPSEVRLWALAEYWTATEAALLLAGVSPDDPELYAVSRQVTPDDPSGAVYYAWKYSFEFLRASESLFLFKRSNLAPKSPPLEWVKYHDRNVRKILGVSDLAPRRYDGWVEFFSAELAESAPFQPAAPSAPDDSGRRERQWDVMLAVCAALKFDPLQIPDGGCAELKSACLSLPLLFTDEGFEHAWKAGKKKNLFKMANRDKFLPK